MTSGQAVILLIIVLFATVFGESLIRKVKKRKEINARIDREWGKVPCEEYEDNDLRSISSFYNNLKEFDLQRHTIDNKTWSDLDMDSVFKRINNTVSTVGEEYLYSILRIPCYAKETLAEREKLVSLFQNKQAVRKRLQILLAYAGKRRHVDISNFFFEKKNPSLKIITYRVLQVIAIAAVFLIFFKPVQGVILFIPSFITNMIVYYREKNKTGSSLEAISYMTCMANCSRKIIKEDIKEIAEYNNRLKLSYTKIKGITNRAYNLLYSSGDPFVEYFKIVFLKELIDFERIGTVLSKHSEEIRQTYEIIGLIDSTVSIASYRKSVQYYTCPILFDMKFSKSKNICIKDAYHPLLVKPVANSISVERSVLVTGSNASGKSTFLKTIAINAILAQTIHTCLAKEYISGFFKVYTSISVKDNLAMNESLFIAEIKALKRILDELDDHIPCLCLLDEVMRGTNTVERIAASSRILFHLNRKNCLCFAATHDIEITTILKSSFDNYHFRESFYNNKIVFDYKLYPGNSKTRNALKLLSLMGLEQSIVKDAVDAANSFLDRGIWKVKDMQKENEIQ